MVMLHRVNNTDGTGLVLFPALLEKSEYHELHLVRYLSAPPPNPKRHLAPHLHPVIWQKITCHLLSPFFLFLEMQRFFFFLTSCSVIIVLRGLKHYIKLYSLIRDGESCFLQKRCPWLWPLLLILALFSGSINTLYIGHQFVTESQEKLYTSM